jgi:hypothetical protein
MINFQDIIQHTNFFLEIIFSRQDPPSVLSVPPPPHLWGQPRKLIVVLIQRRHEI